MKIILTQEVESLGDEGEVVTVADGYARNFLIPNNKAILATPGALKALQSRVERLKLKLEKRYQEDLQHAKTIENLGSMTLEANAGEEGKLFGTITTKELAKALEEKVGFPIDRKGLHLNHPINRVGDYELTIRLSAKVTTTLLIQVVALQSEVA